MFKPYSFVEKRCELLCFLGSEVSEVICGVRKMGLHVDAVIYCTNGPVMDLLLLYAVT